MTLRSLGGALVLSLAAAVLMPAAAEAGHRHSRYCRHRYDRGYSYDYRSYGCPSYGCGPTYRSRGYNDYRSYDYYDNDYRRYDGYRSYDDYYAPPPRVYAYGPPRCVRPRFGFYYGW